MSLRMLRYLRMIAMLAFFGTGIWLALWHHNDGLLYCAIRIIPPWAIFVGLDLLVRARTPKTGS